MAKHRSIGRCSATIYAVYRHINWFKRAARYANVKFTVRKAHATDKDTGVTRVAWIMTFTNEADCKSFRKTVLGLVDGTLTGNGWIDAINQINRESGNNIPPIHA